MTKPVLPFMETMITYACNLSCSGCTNYSDYNMKGHVKWKDGKHWLESWLEILDVPDFGLIGGEPLLHPELNEWIHGCRELMPKSQIRLTTNAVTFLQNTRVLDWCMDIGNCVFKFSIHNDTEAVSKSIDYVFSKYKWEPIVEHGISRWAGPNNVKFQINAPINFVKSYQGTYGNIQPHNSDPRRAFDICVQKTCPLLYNGKIYKCSSIALLNRVLEDWGQPINNDWAPYITDYHPLTLDSNINDINQFLENFGRPHKVCQMCPTIEDTPSIIDHRSTVVTKKQWIALHRT